MSKVNKENAYIIFILLITVCIYQYGIQKIFGFTMYPDEFGYWASAARISGYDWSEVASMGSYYSFGYSLLLVPVLKIFSDGVTAYRAAIGINMLLMCLGTFLVRKIIYKMFPEINTVRGIFLSGIAVFYPSWIFYMQMTMAEALLFFLFVLIVYLSLCFIEKPKAITAAVLAVSLIYTYCVHMRTVGVVIACIVICFLCGFTGVKKDRIISLAILIGVLAFTGWIAMELKARTVVEVFSYADKEVLARNDYGSQWGKFKLIFSFNGMLRLLEGMTGKLFYLGLASFGTFYWALGWCVRESINLLKALIRKQKFILKQWGAFLLLLSVSGEILISSIYMYNSSVADCLIYGRYNELLVPIMIVVGMLAMEEAKLPFSVTILLGTLSGGMALFLLNVIEKRNLKGLRGYHIAGISYLINEENLNLFHFFRDTWMLAFGFMVLLGVLIWVNRRWKNSEWILAGIMLLEIAAGLQISGHYTYRVNRVNFENRIIVEAIKENADETDSITYLDEGWPEFVDFLQMQLQEKPINVIKEDALEYGQKPGDFLITYAETDHNEQLIELYDNKVETNTFCLYFNQDT